MLEFQLECCRMPLARLWREKFPRYLLIASPPSADQSQSQSYITTDGQSVSMSWCLAHLGLLTRVCFLLETSFRQLQVCNFVVPSLTRGRVCKLLYNCFSSADHIHGVGVGVLLAAYSQSTSSSGYQASLWDPWPDFILLFFLRLTITFFFLSKAPSLTRKRVCSLQCNHSLVQ
jgi:hypothetical protein